MTLGIAAIIVTYNGDLEMVEDCVASLRAQEPAPAEIIISDNSPDGRFARHLRQGDPELIVVRNQQNGGFTGGTWSGAQRASSELLFFMNPDARLEPGCLERLTAALVSDDRAAVAGAQILLPDGTVNAGESPVHFSGLSWCGNYRGRPESGRARDAFAVSGCAYLARRELFLRFDGFRRRFKMYYDDTDLCWRTRLAGYCTLFVPEALAVHDYEDKGSYRWLWVERNRLWMLFSNLENRTLLLLFPGLVLMELASWLTAFSGGWWRYKLKAYGQLAASVPWLLGERQAVASYRTVSDQDIIQRLTFELETPGRVPGWPVRVANRVFLSYGRWVRARMGVPTLD